MPFAIWVTGLPGSGKSTIAKKIAKDNPGFMYLRLDDIRKKYVSEPKYTDEERDFVYSCFLEEGSRLISSGFNVIFDATAHKLKWRSEARAKINNIIEVYVKCPLEVCMERESKRKEGLVTADLYRKAIERKKTGRVVEGLGSVVGVDEPYEEDPMAEVVVDSSRLTPDEASKIVKKEIEKKGWK
jgi:adenylylsulfate kinase-like enzyme